MAVDGRMTILALLSGLFFNLLLTFINLLTCYFFFLAGAVVDKANLAPILYKRLHIEGSTLRSRTLIYQAELISQFVLISTSSLPLLIAITPRFGQEVFGKITSQGDKGPVRTYIHKVGFFNE